MAISADFIMKPAQELLELLDYSCPVVTFTVFLVLFVAFGIYKAPSLDERTEGEILGPGGKPLPGKKRSRHRTDHEFGRRQQALFRWLSLLIVFTFAGDAVLTITHVIASRDEGWWCGKPFVIYIIGSFFTYVLILVSLIDSKPAPSIVHAAVWLLATILEIFRCGTKLVLYTSQHRSGSLRGPNGGRWLNSMTDWEAMEVVAEMIRLTTLIGLVILFWSLSVAKQRNEMMETSRSESETISLLNGHRVERGHSNGHAYGVAPQIIAGDKSKPSYARPDRVPNKNWWEYLRGYALFFPYLWPSKSLRLQLYFVLCFLIVCAGRVVNILVPNQVGELTNELTGENGHTPRVPVGGILLYILYRYMQGTNGILDSIRGALWVPISQYSYQELSVASFEHVHRLSYDFHMSKQTGEVTSALGKGNSINTFLEQITFNMLPMMVDLILALGYFLYKFDAYYALVATVMTFAYLYASVRLAMWRSSARREMTNLSRKEDAVKWVTATDRVKNPLTDFRNDSMMSWETVKYFNAEKYEFQRYRNAVQDFQKQEFLVLMSMTVMNVIQGGVFTLGLMISCFLMAYQISKGERDLGSFTALIVYMAQLQGPLNFFSTFYRSIQYAMINSERLLELFKLQPTVVDQPQSKELTNCQGAIQFNDVKFCYDPRRTALDGVTFRCEPGTTTALVGESGGGKSTVFRLLYRYYNLTGGNIQIDDQDLEDLTLDSLRQHIGVVPQDTVLFNETIMYNLKYANQGVTDEDVYAACKAASIHDRILSFADGYNSQVGERGLKLSGGEKQRVAIARAILKNPRIILLDEATAALDSETEDNIQEALSQLSKGRTTIIIAHRLSTITHADQILVLQHGKIVEGGTHRGLLQRCGKYASMWRRQIKAQQAFEEAKILTDRAERLRAQDHSDDSAPQSDDEQSGRPIGFRRRGSYAGTVSSDGDNAHTGNDQIVRSLRDL